MLKSNITVIMCTLITYRRWWRWHLSCRRDVASEFALRASEFALHASEFALRASEFALRVDLHCENLNLGGD